AHVDFPASEAAPPESSAPSLHDALPIYQAARAGGAQRPHAVREHAVQVGGHVRGPHPGRAEVAVRDDRVHRADEPGDGASAGVRSEEHTSELQSREKLVCRLLLEKKKTD